MAGETAQTLYPYPPESPENLRVAQHEIGDVAALLHDTGADVNDGSLLLDSSWSSDTAATAVSDVRLLATLLPAEGGRLATAASAAGRYVQALDDCREAIDTIRTRYDAAVTTRDEANAVVPKGLEHNRYEREEYHHGNQGTLDAAKGRLDVDYAAELETLRLSRVGVLGDLKTVLDVLAPAEFRGPTGSYGQSAFTGVAATLSLVGPVDGTEDPVRRATQAREFEKVFGRPPSGPSEWQTAAALDGTSYLDKNGHARRRPSREDHSPARQGHRPDGALHPVGRGLQRAQLRPRRRPGSGLLLRPRGRSGQRLHRLRDGTRRRAAEAVGGHRG